MLNSIGVLFESIEQKEFFFFFFEFSTYKGHELHQR